MTDEEVNRKFDVVAEHLASLAVKMDRLAEAQAQTDQFVNTLATVVVGGFRDVNTKIDALVDAQIRTEENLQKTDVNVRNLTAVVDRYFRERLNGRS